jgi:hypothetical protein
MLHNFEGPMTTANTPSVRTDWRQSIYDGIQDNRTTLAVAQNVQSVLARLGFPSDIYVQQENTGASLANYVLEQDATANELKGDKIFLLFIYGQYHNADLLGQLLAGGNTGNMTYMQRTNALRANLGSPVAITDLPRIQNAIEKELKKIFES